MSIKTFTGIFVIGFSEIRICLQTGVVSEGVREIFQIRLRNLSATVPPKCVPEAMTAEVDIIKFVREQLGWEPDEKQAEVLRSTAKRGILNCSRQWGKTQVSVAMVVYRVMTRPGSLVVVASPTLRQSGEWMMKAEEMLRRLDIKIRSDGKNRVSVLLPNGSRIVGLPQKEGNIRGFSSVSMIVIDEASRVDDRMYRALTPMLAVSNGELWMLSTPAGKRGFFYETWQHGGEHWHRVTAQATECGRISAEYLEGQRRELDAAMFAQEFLCEFSGSGMHAFDRDVVEAALDGSVEAFSTAQLMAELPRPQDFLSSHTERRFYIGLDLGKKRDPAAVAIIESDNYEMLVHCAERFPLGTPYTKIVEDVRRLVLSPRLAGRCTVAFDGSGVGEPVVEMFQHAQMKCPLMAVVITGGSMAREGRHSGYAHVPKINLMAGLQMALEQGRVKIASGMKERGALVKELLDMRINAKGSMSAEGAGEHDDLVMAVALACWRVKKGSNDRGNGLFV
jgi:hypothetical protein